jgi:hypothetical protein
MCLDPVAAVQEPAHQVLLEIGLACLESFAGYLDLRGHGIFEMSDQARLEVAWVEFLAAH